jgi:hypothetical protein
MPRIADTQRLSRDVRLAEEPGRRIADAQRKAALLIRGRSGQVMWLRLSRCGRLEASRAELQGCILVALLRTPAATSAECAVYRMVWGLFLSHLPYCGTDGRCVARPGRAWR